MRYFLTRYNKNNEICITGTKYINDNEKINTFLYVECSFPVYKYVKDISNTFDLGLNFIRTKETKYINDISQLLFIDSFKNKLDELNLIRKSFKLKAKKVLDSRLKDDNLDMAIYTYYMCKYNLNKKYVYTTMEELVEKVVLSENNEDERNLSLYLDAVNELDRKKNWFDIYVKFCEDISLLDTKEKIEEAFKGFNEKFY